MDYNNIDAGGVFGCFFRRKSSSNEEILLTKSPSSNGQIPLDPDDTEVSELLTGPPSLPKSIILGQGVQQIGTFLFGISTGLMVSNYVSSPYCDCNVTLPYDPSNFNYTCDIQKSGSGGGLISLGATISGAVLFGLAFMGTYYATDQFLKSVRLKTD